MACQMENTTTMLITLSSSLKHTYNTPAVCKQVWLMTHQASLSVTAPPCEIKQAWTRPPVRFAGFIDIAPKAPGPPVDGAPTANVTLVSPSKELTAPHIASADPQSELIPGHTQTADYALLSASQESVDTGLQHPKLPITNPPLITSLRPGPISDAPQAMTLQAPLIAAVSIPQSDQAGFGPGLEHAADAKAVVMPWKGDAAMTAQIADTHQLAFEQRAMSEQELREGLAKPPSAPGSVQNAHAACVQSTL